jgi:hypothetical protein
MTSRDTVIVTAPVQEIARAYAIAAERGVSLSELTIEAWRTIPRARGNLRDPDLWGDMTRPRTEIRRPDKRTIGTKRLFSEIFNGIHLGEMGHLSDYEVGVAEHTARKILWGQFSRFLTVKYTLRVLASLLGNGPVNLLQWQDAVREHAFTMREHLRAKDVRHKIPRGAQLSAGFPKGSSKKSEKSMQRFLGHYTASIQGSGSGPVVGMCAELGLIQVLLPSKEVKLTEAGRDFVMEENPQLDFDFEEGDGDIDMETVPLDSGEQQLLLKHIKSNLLEDWAFCTKILDCILDGWNDPGTLDAAMAKAYPKIGANTLRTNTGGALGRLGDLGLISRSWTGRRVHYSVTVVGKMEAAA